jgi:bifunctional ADP-heptose synthase (sugar kinase/adenylyltransferase)
MNRERFDEITAAYSGLVLAVAGDFCLDRYFEIDPERQELSLETGLPVHNVTRVRAEPGGAGTILANLSALGVGRLLPVGFAGEDGEGFELWHALEKLPGVQMTYFTKTCQRRTFTYCKPLILHADRPPVELNRLDLKNYSPTPAPLRGLLGQRLAEAADLARGVVVLDQVSLPETGFVTREMISVLRALAADRPDLLMLADSRRGLRAFPPVTFKMNAAELDVLSEATAPQTNSPSTYEEMRGSMDSASKMELSSIRDAAGALAARNGKPVFVTLSESGILAAESSGATTVVPALPVRGPIDVVGAGDSVTANLAAALAAGATASEAITIANAAASIVIHKLGVTGTASLPEIAELLF